jgi:hypothetical protein
MDCRIKFGNDAENNGENDKGRQPAGPCCSLQLKWYSLHGNGGAASATVEAIRE